MRGDVLLELIGVVLGQVRFLFLLDLFHVGERCAEEQHIFLVPIPTGLRILENLQRLSGHCSLVCVGIGYRLQFQRRIIPLCLVCVGIGYDTGRQAAFQRRIMTGPSSWQV